MTLNNIKEARKKAGLNQKELAKMLEVSPSTLSEYEKGSHEPKSDVLSKIADICDVTVDFLLCREIKKENPLAPAKPEQGEDKVSMMELEAVLHALGFTKPGEHISDADLGFITDLLDLIGRWLQQKSQKS